MCGQVTHESRRGPRQCQEDRFVVSRIVNRDCVGWLLGVFDGHEGSAVSEFCADKATDFFNLTSAYNLEDALKNLMRELVSNTERFEDGSTASIAFVAESHRRVSIAILGDSPVLVSDRNGQLHVSPEHNVRSNIRERMAAEARGGEYDEGYVYRKGGGCGIQLSRVLGDSNLGEILSREPEVYTIDSPQWVLVASDGVLDPAHEVNGNLIDEVKILAQNRSDAGAIIKWAGGRGLADNATALVWVLNRGMSGFFYNLISDIESGLTKVLH